MISVHFQGKQFTVIQVYAPTTNVKEAKVEWFCEDLQNLLAAKSLQSCPTLCDPIDGSPPGSATPGILQARTLEWVAISFSSFNFSFFSITGQGIDLDYCDTGWFGNEQRSFCCFEIASKYCILDSC